MDYVGGLCPTETIDGIAQATGIYFRRSKLEALGVEFWGLTVTQ